MGCRACASCRAGSRCSASARCRGERLTARVTAAKKSFATAHKVEVLRQHSDAVEAPCVHFQEGCGGCTMQNLAYASQLRAKEQQVCPPVMPDLQTGFSAR